MGLLGVSGWFLTGAALAGAGAVFNLFVPSSLVRGLSFIRIASRYGERLAGHAATLRLLADLRASVFRSLVRLTPRQLARYRGGDLVARLTSDVDALDTVFLFVLAPVAVALAGGAILTAVMGAWIPAAALVVAAALLLCCAVAPWWLARAGRRPGAAVQESAAALRAATLDAVEGHADIAALHAGAQARAQFADACEQSARARAAQVRIAARGQWLAQLAAGAAVLAVLWFGLDGLAAGELGGPLLAGLLLATIGIFEVAGPVMRGVSRLGAAVAAAARIGEIAAREPDLRDPAAPRALPPAGELALEDVTFAYPCPTPRRIRCSTAPACASRPGSAWPSSAPAAPASRPCCSCCCAWRTRSAARCATPAAMCASARRPSCIAAWPCCRRMRHCFSAPCAPIC